MDAQWIKSPTGRRVLEHWADPRPAWLWSADGQSLLWRNIAARMFHGRNKSRAEPPKADTVPIRGQIARLIRLGSTNRSSLSRMQFLVGDRPVSATCACMPLQLPDGQTGLLVVNVDPIAPELLDAAPRRDPALESLLPAGTEYLLIDDDSYVAGGSPGAIEGYLPRLENGDLRELGSVAEGHIEVDGRSVGFTRFKASPQDASLLLFDAAESAAATLATGPEQAAEPDAAPAEPLLPMGLPPVEPAAPAEGEAAQDGASIEPLPQPGGLSSLFDRLADDTALYAPLRPDEDFVPPEPAMPEAVAEAEPEAPPTEVTPVAAPAEPEASEPPAAETQAAETQATETQATEAPALYRIIGRGFAPMAVEPPAPEIAPEPAAAPAFATSEVPPTAAEIAPAFQDPAPAADEPPAGASPLAAPDILPPEPDKDSDSVERVSRYNFDELSRILNDRVGNGDAASQPVGGASPFMPRPGLPSVPSATPEGSLVTLGGETLVLNRLPLGILVFRDQQVLFANRAITEMVGYDSVESLRTAGLAAMFPAAADAEQGAGPVNHLVQRDGTLVPVTARLQSVSWQGKPALMLSASTTEVRTGHEGAVRAFAEMLAATRSDGFIEAGRSGVVTAVSGDARMILASSEEQLLGRPVAALAAPGEAAALKAFFERPARFAETARPAITVKGAAPDVEIMLFAQGQAGVISGYFGFVRRLEGAMLPALAAPASEVDPALLARLSRGVRRPLNTVIGFSDLIGSAAFGTDKNERYFEYARDIKTAGLEIAALVDELDDFARLRDGRYASRPTDIDLSGLLDSSVMRVRGLANETRVLVRSAISERLPRIRADRASLAQAVLNLLASAIDQTPAGGSVVLSAQVDDVGGVVINVRDSAQNLTDLGERFVVFRDGVDRSGEAQAPIRSSVGLALTRALLAVNGMALTVDPAGGAGTLFSVIVPPENVVMTKSLPASTP